MSTNEDASKSGQLDCSDTDALTYAIASGATHGTVSIDDASSGTYTYDPDPNYFGPDSFTFTAADVDDGTSDPATISITIHPIDDPPSFSPGGDQSDLEDAGAETVNNWATGIDPGPPNESGQSVSFEIDGITNSSLFAVEPAVDAGGDLTYTLEADANGSSNVTLHAHDSGGAEGSPSTFTIAVTPVNDEPSFAKGGNPTVSENAGAQTQSGWATGISAGSSNESGQVLTFQVTGNTNPGLFSVAPAVSPNGTLTYTPAASTSGAATITLRLHDDGGTANGGDDTSPTQTFTITVSSVNDPPSFTKGADQADLEDAGPQSVSGWATDISPGPPDEGGQTVTFPIDGNTNPALFASGPTISSNGTLTYTSAANANGSATILLHAHDDGGGATDDSPTQSFTITLTPVNDAPSFTKGPNPVVLENAPAQSIAGWAAALEGPTNEASQNVTFHVTNNTNAALFSGQPSVSQSGTLTFTATPDAVGSATVTLTVQDNGGTANGGIDTSPPQTFTISVTGVNDPPSFTKGINRTVLEDAGAQSITGWATAISPGPPDEAGQAVNFVLDAGLPDLFSSGPAISPTGTLTFTPAANAVGTSTISFFLHDSGGAADGGDDTSLTQSFTVTMFAVNDPPSFVKGPGQTALEDSGLHTIPAWATAILDGPANEASQVVAFVVDSNTNPALFAVPPAVSPSGDLTYTLAPDANGSATISLHTHDNGGILSGGIDASASQAFTITVTGTNDAPTCIKGNDATFVNATLTDTIGSCVDIDGNSLSYALVEQSIHGTAVVNPDGSFTYSPNADYLGNDSFTFKASDGTVDSNIATMTIQVQADPIARNDISPTDFPAINQGSGPTAIPVLANDVDKQGGPLLITAITQGAKGKIAITGGGTGLTYDPTGLTSGSDSFRYTITDNQNRSNTAIVLVVVTPDAIKPVLTSPVVTIVRPATVAARTGRVRLRWTASDTWTGLKSERLQEKIGTGPWKTVTLSTPKAKSALRSFTFGKRYQYRLRATDVVGNVSGWTLSAPFVLGRTQESSGAIVYHGAWRTSRSPAFSGGKDRYATGTGASATFTFSGAGIAWVSSRSSSRGSAQVLIDGSPAGTVNLHGAARHRQVVFSAAWPTSSVHSIQIVVLGTPGHRRIDLDAFVIAR